MGRHIYRTNNSFWEKLYRSDILASAKTYRSDGALKIHYLIIYKDYASTKLLVNHIKL